MQPDQTYQPEWTSEEDICKWLGIDKSTLYRHRISLCLAYTYLNGTRGLMYDKKQIKEVLNKNSTYAIFSDKKLTA